MHATFSTIKIRLCLCSSKRAVFINTNVSPQFNCIEGGMYLRWHQTQKALIRVYRGGSCTCLHFFLPIICGPHNNQDPFTHVYQIMAALVEHVPWLFNIQAQQNWMSHLYIVLYDCPFQNNPISMALSKIYEGRPLVSLAPLMTLFLSSLLYLPNRRF